MSDDTVVYDLAADLLECARAALAGTSQGAPGRRYVSVNRPAHDNCCQAQGQLTVAIIETYPSREFPTRVTDPAPCGAPYTVVTFEVEIIRCAPMSANDGTPPSAALLSASARDVEIDARAVWAGVMCCLLDRVALGLGFEAYGAGQVRIQPQGGCTGSRATFVAGLVDQCLCP